MDDKELRELIEFTTGEMPEEEAVQTNLPTEWDMYVTYLDEAKALILLDLSLAKIAPIFKYNQLFGVQIAINNPTEDGFYEASEQERLFEVEDRVEEIFTKEAGCRFVATVTTGGARMMYFYAKDSNILPSLVGKVAAECNDYQFNYMIEQDAHWDFYYNVLYPSVMDLQLMKNRHVIKQMADAGEDMESDREVIHWYFFANGAARRQAQVLLMSQGAEILDDNFYEEKMNEYPFGLKIMFKHPLNLEAMTEKTYEAYEFMEKFDGIYDGWELAFDGDVEEWI